MKVIDLIIKLQNCDPNLDVLVDKGNGDAFAFISIDEVDECIDEEGGGYEFVGIFLHPTITNTSDN